MIQPDGSHQRQIGTSYNKSPTLLGWTADSQQLVIHDLERTRFKLNLLGLDGSLESPFKTERQIAL